MTCNVFGGTLSLTQSINQPPFQVLVYPVLLSIHSQQIFRLSLGCISAGWCHPGRASLSRRPLSDATGV